MLKVHIFPMVIYPRVRMKEEFLNGAPPGSIAACHPSGWMQLHLFEKWFDHFLKCTSSSKENPSLLILDGHKTHTQNIAVIDKAREHGVTIVCLPPHCSHKMQPLDVSFMAPLSTFYSQEVETYLRNNPGHVISIYQVPKLFGRAYLRAANPLTAIHGFEKSGLFPINRHVFTEDMFAPADPTNVPEPDQNLVFAPENPTDVPEPEQSSLFAPTDTTEVSEPDQSLAILPSCSRVNIISAVIIPPPMTKSEQKLQTVNNNSTSPKSRYCVTPPPSTSQTGLHTEKAHTEYNFRRESDSDDDNQPLANLKKPNFISPVAICPYPKATERKRTFRKNRGKAAVLTSTPYKEELNASLEGRAKNKNKQKIKGKAKRVSRAVFKEETSSSSENEDDPTCFYCKRSYSKDTKGEGWIQCTACKKWLHEVCGNADSDDDFFTCTRCFC